MAVASEKEEGGRGPAAGWGATPRRGPWRRRRSHVVVVGVVHHGGGEQHHGLAAGILPPMGGAAGLRRDLAGLVQNRHGAVAGVFENLALDDINERRTVAMAVPRNDAARFDHEL